VEKIKAKAAGELPVKSKFFNYEPSTKPVRWIEYDRATAKLAACRSWRRRPRPCPLTTAWFSSRPGPTSVFQGLRQEVHKIEIALATFNGAKHVGNFLESLFKQNQIILLALNCQRRWIC